MHGSSSVPQEWLQVIREFGGEIKETYGVPVEESTGEATAPYTHRRSPAPLRS
jgi:hypothetical protein